MHKISLWSLAICAIVSSGTPQAKADVVVVSGYASSSDSTIKTSPPELSLVRETPKEAPRERKAGLHFDVGGAFGRGLSMGGFSGALRLRPSPRFGVDLGAGYYVGNDYNADWRWDVPVTANFLVFMNPKHKAQFYLLAGAGASFGTRQSAFETRDMIHAGGQAGLGLELRLAPAFALNTDLRGFLRKRVDRDPTPEFVSGSRSTDVSGGALFTFGGTLYF